MIRPRKAKPQAGRLRASEITKADQGASYRQRNAQSAESLMKLGVTLALFGVESLSLLTDDPGPGIVEAADLLEAAGELLRGGGGP